MASPPPAASTPSSRNFFGPVKALDKLATATCVLLGLTTVAMAGATFPYFSRANLTKNAIANNVTQAEATAADNAVLTLAVLVIILTLATAAVFIAWQYNHALNAVALRGPLDLGPGWAIGGWFIPLANLVLPFLQIRQAARASDPDLPEDALRYEGRVPLIQVAWMSAWIAASALRTWATTTSPGENEINAFSSREEVQAWLDDFAATDRVAGVAMMLYAAAGVFAILTVRVLTRRQARAIAAMGRLEQ